MSPGGDIVLGACLGVAVALLGCTGGGADGDCPDAAPDAAPGGDGDGDGDADWDTASDPFAPDPEAAAELVDGGLSACVSGFLAGGDAGAYSGYFELGSAAYFVWMDDWEAPSAILRIETRPEWGGLAAPGSYTTTAFDTVYDSCALCVFVETAAGDYWLQPGGAVTFDELTAGVSGIGQPLIGTFAGELSDGTCAGTVQVSFGGVARDVTFGPL